MNNVVAERPKKNVLRALILLVLACAGGYVVHMRWDPWTQGDSIKPPDQSVFLGVMPGSHHIYVIPAKSVTAARGKLDELEQIDGQVYNADTKAWQAARVPATMGDNRTPRGWVSADRSRIASTWTGDRPAKEMLPLQVLDGPSGKALFDLTSGKYGLFAAAFSDEGTLLVTATADDPELARNKIFQRLDVWRRRRPEPWWGMVWMPSFWVTVVLGVAFLVTVWPSKKAPAEPPVPAEPGAAPPGDGPIEFDAEDEEDAAGDDPTDS